MRIVTVRFFVHEDTDAMYVLTEALTRLDQDSAQIIGVIGTEFRIEEDDTLKIRKFY